MVMLHVATDLVVRHPGNLAKGPVYPQTMLAKKQVVAPEM